MHSGETLTDWQTRSCKRQFKTKLPQQESIQPVLHRSVNGAGSGSAAKFDQWRSGGQTDNKAIRKEKATQLSL